MKKLPVSIKSNKYGLVIRLDQELPFDRLAEEVGEKFREADAFFGEAKMAVTFQGRELTKEEETLLLEKMVENSHIRILCVVDEDSGTESYYRQVVLLQEALNTRNGVFHYGSVMDGETLNCDTNLVILGDVSFGGVVNTSGSAVILGSCRGCVNAGIGGDRNSVIAALIMKPIQLRIADKTLRSAIAKKNDAAIYAVEPKVAYLKEGHLLLKPFIQGTMHQLFTAGAEEEKQKDAKNAEQKDTQDNMGNS